MKVMKTILYFIFLALLIVGAVIGVKYSTQFSEKQFLSDLENDRWDDVTDTYNRFIADNKVMKKKYQPAVENAINGIVIKWGDGDCSYEESKEYLEESADLDDKKLTKLSAKNLKYITIEEEGTNLLQKAEKSFSDEKYLDVLTNIQGIDESYSQYDAVSDLKSDCKEIILMLVDYPESEEEYDNDMKMVAEAFRITGHADYRIKEAFMKNHREDFDKAIPVIDDVEKSYSESKYKEAFTTIENALDKDPDNRFLKNCDEEYHNRYVIEKIEDVDKLIDKKDYRKAKKELKNASAIYKCNEFEELKKVVNALSNPWNRVKGNLAEIITQTRAGVKKEKYKVHDAGSGKAYIIKSGKQFFLGNYSKEEVTVLSGVGGGLLSIAGLDLPADLRDLSYDLTHFGEGDHFVFNLAADTIAVVPVIGALKYLKYSKKIAKGGESVKMIAKSDQALKTMKSVKKLSKAKWINSDSASKITKIKNGHYVYEPTINQGYKGRYYPKPKVKYIVKKLEYSDGRKIVGVFPKFKSKTNIYLPKELWKATRSEQNAYLNKELKNMDYHILKKKFTKDEIKLIRKGKLKGYTWHHNEKEGLMQLVDAETHNKVKHTGGYKLWGKGSVANN